MGQKVNPIGLRLALAENWSSKWFAKKNNFGNWLHEDVVIRNFIRKEYADASISKVLIERDITNKINIVIYTGRPGFLLAEATKPAKEAPKAVEAAPAPAADAEAAPAAAEDAKPAEPAKAARPARIQRTRGKKVVDVIREQVLKLVAKGQEVRISVAEIASPDTSAQLVSDNIARQLEKRIGFRRAMKKAIATAMEAGAEGIKVQCKGRLGAAELARTEHYKEGRTPLHTLRAFIDYGFSEANTTAGKIGVKVWICHKEPTEEMQNAVNAKKSKTQKSSAR